MIAILVLYSGDNSFQHVNVCRTQYNIYVIASCYINIVRVKFNCEFAFSCLLNEHSIIKKYILYLKFYTEYAYYYLSLKINIFFNTHLVPLSAL